MWSYEIKTGRLFRPDATLAGTGYAGGNMGLVPEAVNNPDFVSKQAIGPLPPGDYLMVWAVTHPRLGAVAIELVPRPGNVMYGRSSFFCHGDNMAKPGQQAGSDGCIVQALSTRQEADKSDDRLLRVYPTLPPSMLTGIGGH